MFGLLLRAFQSYVCTTFGPRPWGQVLTQVGFMGEGFEPLLPYDRALFDRVLATAAEILERPVETVLEDLGTHIVTNPAYPAPRRLLRFGGATYGDFLLSLEELPDRARLALPEAALPPVMLEETGPSQYVLSCPLALPALGHVLTGILRAMADDYGALVVIEPEPLPEPGVALSIRLHEPEFTAGRSFRLAPKDAAHG